MKHFKIESDEQVKALQPFNITPQDPLKVGHIVTPSVEGIYHTCWDDYPEADAITFEQCMSIMKDEVTEELLTLIGEVEEVTNGLMSTVIADKIAVCKYNDGDVVLLISHPETGTGSISIPSPTATNIRLLVQILKR